MANTVYDQPGSAYDQDPDVGHDGPAAGKKSDPRSEYDPQTTPKGDASDPRGDLRDAEQGGGLYNSGDSDAAAKAASPGNLKDSEESGNGDSLYNPNDRGSRLQRARARTRSLSRNKWIAGAGLGGTGMIALIIILLLLFAGAYKIVDFAEHVAAYEFARTVSQAAESTGNIVSEDVSIESISNDSWFSRVTAPFTDAKAKASGKVNDLWSKFDKFRPNKIISNFQNKGTLQFTYDKTGTGREYIRSVTVSGVNADLGQQSLKQSLKSSLIPGYKFVKQVKFARDFIPSSTAALKASDIGVITRTRFFSTIRDRLNVGLMAWTVGRFAGMSQEAADAQIERDAYAASQGQLTVGLEAAAGTLPDYSAYPKPDNSNAPGIVNQAADTANADIQDGLSKGTPAQVLTMGQEATDGTLPSKAAQDVSAIITESSLSSITNAFRAAIKFINPVYAIATPLCLVYDGSLGQSQSTVDSQSNQTERTGAFVQTAASQLKDGTTASGVIDGSFDYKLGDITSSIAERRASGLPVDTSSYASTEASPTGQYSIADYGLGSTVGGFIDTIAGVCPVLTNLWVAGGIGVGAVVTLGLGSLSGGGLSETIANSSVKELAVKILDKTRAGKEAAAKLVGRTGRDVVLIGGATLIAKQLVDSQTGSTHSSLAIGQPYDDAADDGTNKLTNEYNRTAQFGAPLPDSALAVDNANNQKQLGLQESRQSTFERYASINNPGSLFSRLAILADGYLGRSLFSSLVRLGSALLDPLRSMATVLSPLISHTSFAGAAITSNNTYYGNVQFGWTAAEKKLMDSCPAEVRNSTTLSDSEKAKLCSYQPLENQLILDNYGNEDAISNEYHDCFDDSKTIGQLLTNHDIQRDSNGDILLDEGTCAPNKLSFNNTSDPLANDSSPDSPNAHDMVFRWRLANNYNNALDQLAQEQDVTSSGNAPAAAGGFTNPFPDGWVPNRLDMGYDGAFKNKIVSPCDGTMVYVNANTSHGDLGGWKGAFIAVKCSQPIPGFPSNVFYFAEGLSPTVTQDQTVTAGQQIAVPGWTGYSEGPGGIEWGLGNPDNPATVTLAASGINGMANCNAASKTMVLAFSQWVQKNLGVKAPASTGDAGCA